MATITIDPGHGGADPGAVGPKGTTERSVTVLVSQMLRLALQRRGIESYLTHQGFGASFEARTAAAAESDALVSIHCNAADTPQAHGFEVFSHTLAANGSSDLAQHIAQSVAEDLPELRQRGCKIANFAVLRMSPVPAVLVEMAFISNPSEEVLLGTWEWQRRMADAIAYGVATWLVR